MPEPASITTTEDPEANTLTIVIPLADGTYVPGAGPLRTLDDFRQLTYLILGRTSVAWETRDVRRVWLETWQEMYPHDWLKW